MDLSIKDKDVKNYELTKVEVKTSKDGKTRYAVCEFRQSGLRKVLQEQTRPVVMQLMAAYGSTKEHEDEYFKAIEETIGEVFPSVVLKYQVFLTLFVRTMTVKSSLRLRKETVSK